MTSAPFMGNELLEGDLVRLAKPTRDDVPIIASWTHDMEFSRYLRRGRVYPASVEGMQEWFMEMDRKEDEIPFAIRTLDMNDLVGFLVIKDIVWVARHCSFFIGIGDRAARGKGYGTDAIRVLLKYVFMEMNLNRVGLEVMNYNPAGIRSYEKVGFVQEGRLRSVVYRDGVYYDIIQMGILRSEWEAKYGYPPIRYPGAG